jgi:hypothetical protein
VRGLFWAAVLLALVALVGGGVVAYKAYESTAGPDGAVEGYFAALGRSDAPAALAFGDVPDGPHGLLTSAVLREQQQLAPLGHVEVVSVEQHGDAARVAVRYRLGFDSGARQVDDVVAVHRSGASWRLDRTAVPVRLELTQAADRVRLAGLRVPTAPTLLFPGALPVRFDTPYLQLAAGSRQLGFTTADDDELQVEASAAGRTAVTAAVTSALQKCLGAHPDVRCPLPSPRAVPGSLAGRVDGTGPLQLKVTVADAAAGLLEVDGTVPVTGHYRELDFDNLAKARSGTVRVEVSASAYATQPLRLTWRTGA